MHKTRALHVCRPLDADHCRPHHHVALQHQESDMNLRDRTYSKGREIGAVALDEREVHTLIEAFVRSCPEVAANDDTLWDGILSTSLRVTRRPG
jgi:hypothetical protein